MAPVIQSNAVLVQLIMQGLNLAFEVSNPITQCTDFGTLALVITSGADYVYDGVPYDRHQT